MIPAFALTFVEGLLGPNFAKLAKPLIYVLLLVSLIAGLGIAKCSYDRSIISSHDAKQDVANTKADRAADANVAIERRADDTRLTQEAQQLKEAQSHAQTDTDRSLARFRCIGLQQRARAAHSVVPTCD